MKKRFLLLTTMLSIALVGCGSNKDINATTETSVPMETVTTEPTTEATVESATESTVESAEQEKITGYEVPVDEPTTDENEKVDLSEINDTDNVIAEGNTSEPEPEPEQTTTPEDEQTPQKPTEQGFKLSEIDIETLLAIGATEEQINAVKSDADVEKLIQKIISQDYKDVSTSDSSSNPDDPFYESTDGMAHFEFGECTVGGNM